MTSNALYGDWKTSPEYQTAMLLLLRFEVACEKFDRTLPGFMRDGDGYCGETWIPCGAEARRASYSFASNEKRKLRQLAHSMGAIDSATMRDAEASVNRMSFKAQCELLEHMEREAAGQPKEGGG